MNRAVLEATLMWWHVQVSQKSTRWLQNCPFDLPHSLVPLVESEYWRRRWLELDI